MSEVYDVTNLFYECVMMSAEKSRERFTGRVNQIGSKF